MNEFLPTMTNNKNFLDKMIQNHPQLREKAIVDYIDGLEVINDHISFRRQIINRDSFLNKILDSITGKSQQRQLIINQNVAISLKVISVWLQELECYRIENDIVITYLTNKLSETRNAVMRINGRVEGIADRFEQLQSKLEIELRKLKKRVDRIEAKHHIDFVIAKWSEELWLNYPPLVKLYLSIDELYWGDFGIYCRNPEDSEKVNDLIKYLRNEILKIIKNTIGINPDKPFIMSQWLKPISDLPKEELEMLAYVCDWANLKIKTAPVTWSIHSYATSYTPPHAHNDIPIVLNFNTLFYCLIDEHNDSAKFNYNP